MAPTSWSDDPIDDARRLLLALAASLKSAGLTVHSDASRDQQTIELILGCVEAKVGVDATVERLLHFARQQGILDGDAPIELAEEVEIRFHRSRASQSVAGNAPRKPRGPGR